MEPEFITNWICQADLRFMCVNSFGYVINLSVERKFRKGWTQVLYPCFRPKGLVSHGLVSVYWWWFHSYLHVSHHVYSLLHRQVRRFNSCQGHGITTIEAHAPRVWLSVEWATVAQPAQYVLQTSILSLVINVYAKTKQDCELSNLLYFCISFCVVLN